MKTQTPYSPTGPVFLLLTISPPAPVHAGGTRSQIRHEELRSRADFDPPSGQAAARRKAPSTGSAAQVIATTPSVGPNVQVNAQQQTFPNGLIGRSETTVASSADGQLIAVGFTTLRVSAARPSAPLRVSSVTSDWCATFSNVTPNFGDYIGSVSVDRKVLSTWADSRNVLPNITPNHIADTFYATGFGV